MAWETFDGRTMIGFLERPVWPGEYRVRPVNSNLACSMDGIRLRRASPEDCERCARVFATLGDV